VLVVEVDGVDTEPLERGVAGLANVVGIAADAKPLAVRPAHISELRCQHDLIPSTGDRAPDELLIRERSVRVGRVEEVHAKVEGAVDRRDRLILVGRSVELGHAHAAQSELRDFEPLATKCSCIHYLLLSGTGSGRLAFAGRAADRERDVDVAARRP
jgi:hypothetical protein